jgi:hypothetical protein
MNQPSTQHPAPSTVTQDDNTTIKEVSGLPIGIKTIDSDQEDFPTAEKLAALGLGKIRYTDGR